ncbi:MAG: glycosyltransferase family 4 protein [Deltaproteobacteria bacterium]|nr:glycosyltransferase family 4 protein [Deltaproteobacteria bacterium]
MRIAIDATTWAPGRTGVGLYTERLVRAWQQLPYGDELILLTNRFAEAPRQSGLPVYGPRMPVRALWLQTALPAQLVRFRPDAALFPNYLAPIVPVPGVPYVLTVHDLAVFLYPETFTFKKRVLQRAALPWLVRRAAAVVTPSESSRRDLLRLMPTDPAKVVVTPLAAAPGLDRPPQPETVARVRRELALPDRYVLSVGTLEPRKNVVRLVEAFERVANAFADVRLVIAGGKGWRDADIVRLLRRPELQSRIVSVGYVTPEQLQVLYCEALVMAYPSLYEGYGLPVAEAMACGAPVLTSRGSSLDEVGGDAVLAVDPLDVGAIADGLARLLGDASLRADLRSRGLARAAQSSWVQTAEATRAVLARAAGHG